LFSDDFGALHYVLWAVTIGSVIPALIAYVRRESGYFGQADLAASGNRPDARAS
jgi:hypothetical protein